MTIIPEEPSEFRPIPDVAVFASANTTKKGPPAPEASALASKSEAKFKVAVVHASIDVPGLSIDPDEPLISLDEIASSPFDYIAMGHWHKRQAWPTGDPKAWYCGTPETLEFDDAPSPGCVNWYPLALTLQLRKDSGYIQVGETRYRCESCAGHECDCRQGQSRSRRILFCAWNSGAA